MFFNFRSTIVLAQEDIRELLFGGVANELRWLQKRFSKDNLFWTPHFDSKADQLCSPVLFMGKGEKL